MVRSPRKGVTVLNANLARTRHQSQPVTRQLPRPSPGFIDSDTCSGISQGESTETHETVSSDNDFLFISAKFHNLEVAELLDSGSNVSLISQELYSKIPASLKMKLIMCSNVIWLADSSVNYTVGK